MAWGSPLVCGARLSHQWSGACLSYTWEAGYSTLLGLLIGVLAPLLASGDFAREPICGWARSADAAALTHGQICLLADVSALTEAVSLLIQSVTADWQPF